VVLSRNSAATLTVSPLAAGSLSAALHTRLQELHLRHDQLSAELGSEVCSTLRCMPPAGPAFHAHPHRLRPAWRAW
jgi:hypothetical protein